jgi:chromosome segregation ATPase
MIDELERRVRTLEEELSGERHVSRYMVEQAGRNSEVLHAVRSEVAIVRSEVAAVRADVSAVTARVDVLAGGMASARAALVMHGRALDVLQQDVRQLRVEVSELRQGMDAMDAKLDAILEAIHARLPRDPPA